MFRLTWEGITEDQLHKRKIVACAADPGTGKVKVHTALLGSLESFKKQSAI
ncbi:MAG: hypothetical protein OXG88_00700 [Gammaproteobacteria bacterium]|nr:hypothetical protein [Gammaproteobacteria bacterium]